uniref:Fungal lipase-like domain-containing protein n=1 Tax=Araucaria cunninghamii TaxID=56994 RepID=A0A0D6R2P0_ARACU
MSLVCGGIPLLECVYCIACARWAWKRCLHTGEQDSQHWGHAAATEFEPVPRMCRLILAVYEEDLHNPRWAPPRGYEIDPDCVLKRATYSHTRGRAPPYIIYLDHEHRDIVFAIRGLNMAMESDYALLWDNKLGQAMFDGGFVHNGLLKSAVWLLVTEGDTLKELLAEYPEYTLTFAGHSLGSGIAALMALVVAKNRDLLDDIPRNKIRCYAIAPARCMSLNLAVRYADIVNSVVLQDDFLPRTATPLEDIFKSICCLPCLLCVRCIKDTFIPEEKMLADPRRLYAPGRLYHIVERKLCRCGRFPPIVKTAVPVEGRFEHIILSCNATKDHAVIWIERESQKALDLMIERERAMEIPSEQKMQRQETLVKEHAQEYKAALERAVTLRVPDGFSTSDVQSDMAFDGNDDEAVGLLDEHREKISEEHEIGESSFGRKEQKEKGKWNELLKRLLDKKAFDDSSVT